MKYSLSYSPQTNNQLYWPSFEKPTDIRRKAAAGAIALLRGVGELLTASSELKVWKSKDRSGQEIWSAYDRHSGRYIQRLSEADMRVWLEDRYRG